MDKASENPVPPRTKDEGGRIIESATAEARERIGRIEKEASGSAQEAQAAAQAIEERSAEREIAAHDIKQQGEHGETLEAAPLAGKRKGGQKSGADDDEPREASAQGHARMDAGDEPAPDDLTRGHYGVEAGARKK